MGRQRPGKESAVEVAVGARRTELPEPDRTWTDGAAIVRPDAAAPVRESSSRMTKQGCSVVRPPSSHAADSPSRHAPE